MTLRHLLESWKHVEPTIRGAGRLALLLDFDGTLTPIRPRPEMVTLPGAVARVLRSLAACPRIHVAVISGRSLRDLRPRLPAAAITLVGNHGAESISPGKKAVRYFGTDDLMRIRTIEHELNEQLAGIPGLLIENKGPVLAVHYRNVDPARVAYVKRVFGDVIRPRREQVRAGRGKMVLEVRPRHLPDKGAAVRSLLRDEPASTVPIYFGDDETDQDAFRIVRRTGIAVQVGPCARPAANYCVDGPPQVLEALQRINRGVKTR